MKPIEVILNSFITSVNDKFNVNANLTPACSSRKMHKYGFKCTSITQLDTAFPNWTFSIMCVSLWDHPFKTSANFPGLRTSAASMASTASTTQWPLQTHFIKTNTAPDDWILSGNQKTNTGPFLWNGLSKIQIFTNIWYSFCRRLMRSAILL